MRGRGIASWLAAIAALAPATAARDSAPKDPMDDVAAIEFERFSGVRPEGGAAVSDEAFNRYAATAFFPMGTIGERDAFGGLEAELLGRALRSGSGDRGGGLQQRYALTLGTQVIKREGQESFAMASAAYNGDFRRVDWDGVGTEWIYAHYFIGKGGLRWGLGADLMRYFDDWQPFPLLFLDWWMLDRTKLRINGDYAELRQFLGGAACLTVGSRYSLYYGSFGRSSTFALESIGWEAGVEYRLTGDIYLRAKARLLQWGRDALGGKGGCCEDSGDVQGQSLRLTLSWAP